MKWPPSKCWTSPESKNGNRHFLVKNYGGKGDKRWVELFPTKDKKRFLGLVLKNFILNGLVTGLLCQKIKLKIIY